MSNSSSFKAVATALAGNVLIALCKFVAFFVSGSGAMLSEAVHSSADAGNQLLLYLGIRRAERESDSEHPYGYGAERFVFGILSAAGIFFIGCGVTVYHGIHSLLHPGIPEIGMITFVVLGLSFLIEGYSMAVAVRAVCASKGNAKFFKYLFDGADPASVAIVFEDAAAILGLILAAIGILLAHWTGNPFWDALGSTLVGLLLGVVAFWIAKENRELLLGKSVSPEITQKFRSIVENSPGVRCVHDIKSRQLTPEVYKLKAEFMVNHEYIAQKLAETELTVSWSSPEDQSADLQCLAQKSIMAISDLIDHVEKQVVTSIPQAKHIDLEVDHTGDKLNLSNSQKIVHLESVPRSKGA